MSNSGGGGAIAQKRRRPASLSTQAFALLSKNAKLQKRRWLTNLNLVFTPIFFCLLLWGLQELINNQIKTRAFRCGCKCTSCYDWVRVEGKNGPDYKWEFFQATEDKPCSPYSKCVTFDDTSCGVQYSRVRQAAFCAVESPPVYPPFLKVPLMRNRYISPDDEENYQLSPEAAPLLYTGEDEAFARELMERLLPPQLSDAQLLARLYRQPGTGGSPGSDSGGRSNVLEIFNTFLDNGACSGRTDASSPSTVSSGLPSEIRGLVSGENSILSFMANFTQALGNLGIVLGTPAKSANSLFLDPALLPAYEDDSDLGGDISEDDAPTQVEPLYITMDDCSSLTVSQERGLGRASCVTELLLGRRLECVSLTPLWRDDPRTIDKEIYCGWRDTECEVNEGEIVKTKSRPPEGKRSDELTSALYDWKSTDPRSLDVNIRANDSILIEYQKPPNLERWNQPMNMAANAFLRYKLNDDSASIRLNGLKGMPKPETQLTIDFSSLLGPLFFMWLLQLLLPVNVHSLMYEKEGHLRVMMKMQGLDDRAFYIVTYLWQLFIYCILVTVFMVFGSFTGLAVFTKNSITLQAAFFFLWGNLMIAWGFWIASLFRTTKTAVHSTVVFVIGSGLVSNLMLSQFAMRGPRWLAFVMQFVPSFGLFRGLWELAQYAFLASSNNGVGLTWAKLNDEGNGMKWVFVIFAAEWVWILLWAWYNDQVIDNGTGIRRHPLFLFGKGFKHHKQVQDGQPTQKAVNDLAESLSSMVGQQNTPGAQVTVDVGSSMKDKKQNPSQKALSAKSTKSSNNLSGASGESSRSSRGVSRVIGGTPIDDGEFVDAGSYWGSAGSPPTSPMSIASPILLEALEQSMNEDVECQVTHERTKSRPNGVPFADGEAPDVSAERLRVEKIWENASLGRDTGDEGTITLRHLRKVYPSYNHRKCPPKVAVDNLSLAIDKCQCFGLLGGNGAGKTTTIRMMEGFLEPTKGSVVIDGMDTKVDMAKIYSIMGVCPQHDLLWESLTAREHLMFYGRLKNLRGSELDEEVIAALKSVNLYADGVGDKLVGSYSGGMKRRLSVAISLIGDPVVVYLDEPSTGLDPSSRRLLWHVIKKAKRNRAVVLTTHSMEEAEALCDRLGVFVSGRLQCIGNPRELTSRYGGYLQFSLTTPPGQEPVAAESVYQLCPTARPVYSLGGTQKFELPTADIDLDSLFKHMEEVQKRKAFNILDWGVSNATLEEVFIKITREAGVRMTAFTS